MNDSEWLMMASNIEAAADLQLRTHCVFCNHARRFLVLACLHRICGSCLDEHISLAGSLKCPQCQTITSRRNAQRHLHSSLPSLPLDIESQAEVGDSPEAKRRVNDPCAGSLCDMCEDDQAEIARSTCVDCSLALCLLHAKEHTKKRYARNHRIVDGSGGKDLKCDIHPTLKLTSYCFVCKEIICEKCCQDHTEIPDAGGLDHCVKPIADAADKLRADIQACFGGQSPSSHAADMMVCDEYTAPYDSTQSLLSRIAKCIDDIRVESDATDDGVSLASKRVEECFSKLHTDLDMKKQMFLDELDSIRWKRSQDLASQSRLLQQVLQQYRAAQHLTKLSGLSDVDTIRLQPFLLETDKRLRVVVEQKKHIVTASCSPVFNVNVQQQRQLQYALESFGEVQDAGIDMAFSKLDTSHFIYQSGQVRVNIDIRDRCNQCIPSRFLRDPVTATITNALDADSRIQLEIAYSSKEKIHVAEQVITETGKYILEVKGGSRHFPGSPSMVQVGMTPLTFDPCAMAKRRLRIDDDMMFVEHKEEKGNAVVLGSIGFGHLDQAVWTVKVDGVDSENYMFLGVTTLPLPPGVGFELNRCRDTTYGWLSTGKGYQKSQSVASANTAPWSNEDELVFRLDCKRGTLSIENKMEEQRAVINGVNQTRQAEESAGPLYFFAYLYDAAHSLRLIH